MKTKLCQIALILAIAFTSCDFMAMLNPQIEDLPTPEESAGLAGEAEVSITLGKVGVLTKRADIMLQDLNFVLSAEGETDITDYVKLDPYNATTVIKSFKDLKPEKTWTIKAESKDIMGKVIHSGTAEFYTKAGETAKITLSLNAAYSMLSLHVDSKNNDVQYLKFYLDSTLNQQVNFGAGAEGGQHAYIGYDYLTVGQRHELKIQCFGKIAVDEVMLYEGSLGFTPLSGEDESHDMVLKWVGPAQAPANSAVLDISFGSIATVNIYARTEEQDNGANGGANSGADNADPTMPDMPDNGNSNSDNTSYNFETFNGPAMPYASYQDAAAANGKLQVLIFDKETHLFSFNPDDGTWERNSMPEYAYFWNIEACNEKVYHFRDMMYPMQYDPSTDNWTVKAQPHASDLRKSAALHNKIYYSNELWNYWDTAFAYVYDTDMDKWENKIQLPGEPGAMGAFNDKLLIFSYKEITLREKWNWEVLQLDPTTGTTTHVSNMPEIWGIQNAVQINERMYIVNWNSIREYDPNTGVWGPEVIFDFRISASAALNSHLYLFVQLDGADERELVVKRYTPGK